MATKIRGNDVDVFAELLPTVSYGEALNAALDRSSFLASSSDAKKLIAPGQHGYSHAFVSAVQIAYARHYPLVLSPDMIWLLIAQGFALHVRQNAETLRDRFVAHQGKINLYVERDGFFTGFADIDWENVFSEFSDQIRTHIGEAAHSVISPICSTTGTIEKAAFEITLMDAMQSYFTYEVGIVCGIPWFVLEGTPEDWKQLRSNASMLAQYDLDWWVSFLLPVLDEFIAASTGNPNPAFWANFCYLVSPEGCGTETTITGIIRKFFPYINDTNVPIPEIDADEDYARREAIQIEISQIDDISEYLSRMRYLLSQMRRVPTTARIRNPCLGETPSAAIGLGARHFPSALSLAPFTLSMPSGVKRSMEFVAGFVGFAQDEETFAIRPEIGWAVRDAKQS